MNAETSNPYEEPVSPLVIEASKKSSFLRSVINVLIFTAVGLVLIAITISGGRSVPTHRIRTNICRHNLSQIGLALHQYRSDHGSFPPIVTKDAEGRPLHSWRVLILPYLEEKALYDRIDLSQPWDAPINQPLHAQCPEVYRCTKSPLLEGHTTYQAILDSKAWSQKYESSSHKKNDKFDSRESVMVMESYQDQTIRWMDPKDPDWKAHQRAISTSTKKQIHLGVIAQVLRSDGSVDYLSEEDQAAWMKDVNE
ncbi:MAG: DUF1559 domain-containing protein [Pirellulales bacterium]